MLVIKEKEKKQKCDLWPKGVASGPTGARWWAEGHRTVPCGGAYIWAGLLLCGPQQHSLSQGPVHRLPGQLLQLLLTLQGTSPCTGHSNLQQRKRGLVTDSQGPATTETGGMTQGSFMSTKQKAWQAIPLPRSLLIPRMIIILIVRKKRFRGVKLLSSR